MGVEEPEPPGEPPRDRPGDTLLGVRNRVLVGLVFVVLYIATFGPRTGYLPAVVSGALGGAVVFLLLKEADERRRRRR